MTEALAELFDVATAMTARAYAPYSHFPVGAAIRSSTGAIYAGCNVENAAYPVGTCAEAGAIAAMVAAGESRIADIAIVGGKANPCQPCGACRQRIFEFSSAATRIHVLDSARSTIITAAISDLLPHAFGPGDVSE